MLDRGDTIQSTVRSDAVKERFDQICFHKLIMTPLHRPHYSSTIRSWAWSLLLGCVLTWGMLTLALLDHPPPRE